MNTIAKITFDDWVTPEQVKELVDDLQVYFIDRGFIVNIQVNEEEILIDEDESEVQDEDH